MQDLYQLISKKLNDIIPCEWTKMYLYAEILDDSTMVLFHFKTPEKHQLIYSQDIPARYSVNKDIFNTFSREIRELFEELRIKHKKNNDKQNRQHPVNGCCLLHRYVSSEEVIYFVF
ncbi:TIGR01741 family protein [Bacillus velezensis]|nr:DNA-binding protein [Bacillus velezensis]QOH65426.1 TIGR01741 family protein [Bacillus amyloliquefaciens]